MSEKIIPIKNLHVGLVETLQGANGYLQILKKRNKQSGCGGGEGEREKIAVGVGVEVKEKKYLKKVSE